MIWSIGLRSCGNPHNEITILLNKRQFFQQPISLLFPLPFRKFSPQESQGNYSAPENSSTKLNSEDERVPFYAGVMNFDPEQGIVIRNFFFRMI